MALPRSVQNSMLADGAKLDNLPADTNAELALKVDKTTTVNGQALSGNVTLTKSDLGLGNVDNTSDLNKPISTATQTALDTKLESVVAGTNITVDNTDPLNPVISSTGGGSSTWGGITGTLSNQTDLQTALDGKVDENVAITGATKTKITYDAKGLVTAGADATTADIADSTNKRYVTDAQLTVIGNTSGTNTGDDKTSVTGILKGNGSVISAAIADTDYLTPATAASTYAPIAKGVTNGDSHDHSGGDGAQIDHGGLAGLTDDDHTQYALTCTNQYSVTNYTFLGTETRNSGYAVSTTGGSRTINIDADLFSTGFEVIICKFTNDANTVTLDAQTGNTIDGAQTYVLTKYGETVVLVKDGASTWKIKSSHIGKASEYSPVAGSASIVTVGTVTTGIWNAGAVTSTGVLTTGAAAGTTGATLFKGTTSGTVTLSVADAAGTWTMKLPTTAGTNGYFLQTDGAGNTTWAAASGGGLSWNATANGATGTGLAPSMDNSYAASGIGQSITIGNTQTQDLTALKLNIGSSARNHFGIYFTGGISSSTSTTQDWIYAPITGGHITVLRAVRAVADTSAGGSWGLVELQNNNSTSGYESGLSILSLSQRFSTSSTTFGYGAAIRIDQSVSGTSFSVYGANNVNSSTNGLVNYTLSNTQSGATVMQKTDSGTSAQGHIHHLINMYNASTSARGIKIDPSTTCTGYGIEIGNTGGNGFRGIFHSVIGRNATSTCYGIYQSTIGNSVGSSVDYGFYQGTINSGSGTAYGIYQAAINSSSGTAYGIYISSIGSASLGNGGKYFSLNNNQSSATLQERTNDASEILFSRTGTHTTGTKADDFNLQYLKRTSVQNGAGGTFTAAGSVLKLENVATQTAGTLTDSVAVLSLVQDNDSTGGHILFNSYSGTPTTNGTFWFDGTDLKLRAGGTTYTITKS